jgi:hypothetical protein
MEKIVMVISDGTVIDVIEPITGTDNRLIIFIGFACG